MDFVAVVEPVITLGPNSLTQVETARAQTG